MIDVKYYLVVLADSEEAFQRTTTFHNRLVVGLVPTEWFAAMDICDTYTLVNFWEIKEGTFGDFPHDLQNAAWDDYQKFISDEDEDALV